jgi:uncharacterized damage-inducible protein DinB
MDRDDLVNGLASTPAVLRTLVRGMSEEELRAGHGADAWSVKEIVFHLRDVDEVFLERFQRIVDEANPDLPSFDQEAYARERGYNEGNAEQALADFVTFRARMVELLTEADLDRAGRHEEWGRMTIAWGGEHLISHDLQHLAQIAGIGTGK